MFIHFFFLANFEEQVKVDELMSDALQPGESSSALIEKLNIKQAAAAALKGAAEKARGLAKLEEKEIQQLVAFLLERQLRKLDLKMQYFEALEQYLQKEKVQLEQSSQQLAEERLNWEAQKQQSQQHSQQQSQR